MNVNEPADYPDYQRIDDIEDVHKGDMVVCKSGNRYEVRGLSKDGLDVALVDTLYGDVNPSHFTVSPEMFAYALRREKPQLMDKPGLWVDRNGDLWSFAVVKRSPVVLQGTQIRRNGIWLPKVWQAHVYTDMFADDYAPFHPYKPENNE